MPSLSMLKSRLGDTTTWTFAGDNTHSGVCTFSGNCSFTGDLTHSGGTLTGFGGFDVTSDHTFSGDNTYSGTNTYTGDIDVQGNIVSTSDGDIAITPNGTGKVGIGTSSPGQLLDVSGDIGVKEKLICTTCDAALVLKSGGSAVTMKTNSNQTTLSVAHDTIDLMSGNALGGAAYGGVNNNFRPKTTDTYYLRTTSHAWKYVYAGEIIATNSFRLPSVSMANRPAAGTAGRMIWLTSQAKPNFDTGTAWVLADGTASTS